MQARQIRSTRVFAAVSFSLIPLLSATALAQWTSDPSANLALGDKSGEQAQAKIRVNPVTGGSYVSWFDNSTGGYDITLQSLDAKGHELWPHDGILVADRSFSSTQSYGVDVSAAGESYLAFRDDRFGGVQVTAARIESDGTLAWGAANGVQLTSTSDFIGSIGIAATTDGHSVVAWSQESTVRLQKLDAAGVAQWGAGLILGDAFGGSYLLSDLHASNDGSVIVSWIRQQSFSAAKHIYTQKYSADGVALWSPDPVVVFDGGSLQFGNFPSFVSDGSGGAVFGWYSTSPSLQCWAQRIAADGSEVFPHNGVAGSTQAGQLRVSPGVDYDAGTGETFMFWTELNGGQSQWGVSGQKLSAAGTRQWTDTGRVLVPLGSTEITQVRTVALGGGSAVALFVDKPSPPFGQNVRVARVDGAGDFVWTPDIGFASSVTASKSRLDARLAPNGTTVLAWSDGRADSGDIFAQNVNADGSLGLVGDVDGDSDVDFQDLILLLAAWGDCPVKGDCPADLNGDGLVNFQDLLLLLANWC